MRNKKAQIFLWIGLAVFALSVIAVSAWMIIVYRQYSDVLNRPGIEGWMNGMVVILNVFLVGSGLLVELACIRCVYKILKYWPRGMIGICYWVAAVLSFVELVLQCLVMSGLVNYVTLGVDANSVANFFVYTQWPVFIVSSILSSLPIRHKTDSDNGSFCNSPARHTVPTAYASLIASMYWKIRCEGNLYSAIGDELSTVSSEQWTVDSE